MMQELDDRLKEQIDKLEHLRLASTELKDLSGVHCLKVKTGLKKIKITQYIVRKSILLCMHLKVGRDGLSLVYYDKL